MKTTDLVIALVLLQVAITCNADPVEPRFRNLQVLPEDSGPREVLLVMKLITRSLGAHCATCHRTATRDFDSDDLPAKLVARVMMRLEQDLRPDLDWRNPPADLCFECHRGTLRPPVPGDTQ